MSVLTGDRLTGSNVEGRCRLGPWTALLLLLLTASYLLLLTMLPSSLRMVLFAGGAIVILGFWNPTPGFWLPVMPFIFLFGGSTFEMGEFNPSVLTLAMMVFLGFYLLHMALWNEKLPPKTPVIKLAFLALLIQVVSIAVSIHVQGQYAWNAIREGSSVFLFMPMVFIVPGLCRNRNSINHLARALVIVLFIAGLGGVIEFFSITSFSRVDMSLGYIYRGRVTSFLGNPNVFAGYLELSIPLALAVGLWSTSRKWKIISYSAVALGLLSVLYTFSRGGLLAVTLGAGAVLLYRFRRRPWIPVIIGCLFVALLLTNASVFERQVSFFKNPQELASQPTLLHRYVTYKGYMNQFMDAPVTGIGWGAREFFWGRTRLYSFWEVRHSVSTGPIRVFGGLNSLFFSHAVKGGIISLIALLLIMLAAAKAALSALSSVPFPWAVGLGAGLLGFALHQTMDNFLYWPQTNSFFWLTVGLLVAVGCFRFGTEEDESE